MNIGLGILFDFNGTLFFDSKKHEEAWNLMSLKIRNKPFLLKEMKEQMHGRNNDKIIDYLSPAPLSKEENEKLSLEKEAYYRELCLKDKENLHLVKGVKEFFQYLKEKNISFTIASASPKVNIDFFIDVFELDTFIDPSLIVYNDGTHEDKISMFMEAAKKINVAIENCIVFEDSISGIKNAISANVKDVIVINEHHMFEDYKDLGVSTFIKDFTFDYQDLLGAQYH